jgi:hypothetical protein
MNRNDPISLLKYEDNLPVDVLNKIFIDEKNTIKKRPINSRVITYLSIYPNLPQEIIYKLCSREFDEDVIKDIIRAQSLSFDCVKQLLNNHSNRAEVIKQLSFKNILSSDELHELAELGFLDFVSRQKNTSKDTFYIIDTDIDDIKYNIAANPNAPSDLLEDLFTINQNNIVLKTMIANNPNLNPKFMADIAIIPEFEEYIDVQLQRRPGTIKRVIKFLKERHDYFNNDVAKYRCLLKIKHYSQLLEK